MVSLFLDEDILKNNLDITKKLAGNKKIIAVVKGNAYGLGLVPYSKYLVANGISCLAVTDPADAYELRDNGINCEILNLSPNYEEAELKNMFEKDITISISSKEGGLVAQRVASSMKLGHVNAQLIIDTDLGRHGFKVTDKELIKETISLMSHVFITGIFTHFAFAAYKKDKSTLNSLKCFTDLCDTLTKEGYSLGTRHAAATCAFLRYPDSHLDGVRVGSALVGRIPFSDKWGFKPVGQLRANVEDINLVKAGHSVGYGKAYTTKRDTKIAIIPIGYTHGLGLQRINNCTRVSQIPRFFYRIIANTIRPETIFAHRGSDSFPVLGFVGMTSLIIDVTGADIQVNDEVFFNVNPMYVDSKIPRNL